MYPQIDNPFRCINIYSRKASVALCVQPFTLRSEIFWKTGVPPLKSCMMNFFQKWKKYEITNQGPKSVTITIMRLFRHINPSGVRLKPTELCKGNYHRNKTIQSWSNSIQSLHRKSSQLYGVPTERSFYHRKCSFRLKNKANIQRKSSKYIEN